MTSVVGHISHLHENLDLTFGEMFEILNLAFEGKLEQASEKVDGINLVFSWCHSVGIKVARSLNDIKTYGMTAEDLSDKFADKGNVRLAFNEGFKTLQKAIEIIPEHDLIKIFGTKTNRWFSIEIVYSKMDNTINYDGDYLVFHSYPIFELNHGVVLKSSNIETGKLLDFYITQMQNAVKMRNWKISGHNVLNMKSMSDGTALNTALELIHDNMQIAGVVESDTIRDYIRGMALLELNGFNLPKGVANMIANRIAKIQGAPNLIQIKKLVDISVRDKVDRLIKSEIELKKKWMLPLETAIKNFTIEVLGGLRSTLIGDHDAEVKRLRERLVKAIDMIKTSGNTDAINVLNSQIDKINLDKIIPLEGICFKYKDQLYKFTGNFGSINRILGLFKFGPLTSIDIDIERETNER